MIPAAKAMTGGEMRLARSRAMDSMFWCAERRYNSHLETYASKNTKRMS